MIKGYKVFNFDWTCRGFQYKVGETYSMHTIPKCCERGFHFCEKAADCFNYYDFDPNNKVAEIEAFGAIDTYGNKSCTNKIKIVREIHWTELLNIVNTGKYCTGRCNTGDSNSGNYNTGEYNLGDFNSGNYNIGDANTGNYNIGDANTGYYNTGDYNTGSFNAGDCNTGKYNTGSFNTGGYNTGHSNTGHCNSGHCNTGYYNIGDYNTGDYNTTSFSTGVFNTEETKILMFNKPSNWSYKDWQGSEARYLLSKMPKNIKWIYSKDMTDEEKNIYSRYETTDGYLKVMNINKSKYNNQLWWNRLQDKEKEIIKSIPNFDKKIFEQITGIKINE